MQQSLISEILIKILNIKLIVIGLSLCYQKLSYFLNKSSYLKKSGRTEVLFLDVFSSLTTISFCVA